MAPNISALAGVGVYNNQTEQKIDFAQEELILGLPPASGEHVGGGVRVINVQDWAKEQGKIIIAPNVSYKLTIPKTAFSVIGVAGLAMKTQLLPEPTAPTLKVVPGVNVEYKGDHAIFVGGVFAIIPIYPEDNKGVATRDVLTIPLSDTLALQGAAEAIRTPATDETSVSVVGGFKFNL